MLVLENIHFKYKEPLLQNIHLRLAPGKLMALTGASGSGKSTLLKLIYGSLAPEKGQIHWKKEALLGPEYNLLPGAPFLRYLAHSKNVPLSFCSS
jgi:iron(III) transport system ATP-binding protein